MLRKSEKQEENAYKDQSKADDEIENDSKKSMQSQQTKRIDHITIDNDLSDSDEEEKKPQNYNNEVSDHDSQKEQKTIQSSDTDTVTKKIEATESGRDNSLHSNNFKTLKGYSTNTNTPLRQNSGIQKRFK